MKEKSSKTAEGISTSKGTAFVQLTNMKITLEKAKHEADAGYVLVGGQSLCVWEIGTAVLLFDKW